MKSIMFVLSVLWTLNLWAVIYECNGEGYHVKIFNPESIAGGEPALIIKSVNGTSSVLASDLRIIANFDIRISGRTVPGTSIQYVTISVDDPGVELGHTVKGKMTLDTAQGRLAISLNCVRGASNIP
ncbi:MAG: hypothetical protein A2381_15765 [Bdellovibrionales bacterium RIFOXYB1_FULL_37_110]|nr:MAG: hypothetical protein A2417_07615 [Bdellovibrionales bacterium RIFOXYC1_FULL_37_79]OFZ57072.1 MAG: hypothetical protein A2381_15765 [Bdellovibrionales bacterium RIFOXYB1_FULL_37_110]OFZ62077.1 MAG: hypothetical protein A2577_08465 [Bdellovibrionales bacterium RIFOXYD1_FULL_36_51]